MIRPRMQSDETSESDDGTVGDSVGSNGLVEASQADVDEAIADLEDDDSAVDASEILVG